MQQCFDTSGRDGSSAAVDLIDGVGVFRAEADAFVSLDPAQRLLAYHLAQAAVAGDPIVYDQRSRVGRAVKELAEELALHEAAIDESLRQNVERFAKSVLLHKGLYDSWTGRKLQPSITREQLTTASRQALADGAKLTGVRGDADLGPYLNALSVPLFDASFEPRLFHADDGTAAELIRGTSATFYEGVTLADLGNVSEAHPLNSRLVKQGSAVSEQVYRAGRDGQVQPGLYAGELRRVLAALQAAADHATGTQAKALSALSGFLRSGEQSHWDDFSREWVQDRAPVGAWIGFAPTQVDPRWRHGEYAALVFMTDPDRSQALAKLAAELPRWSSQLPWPSGYQTGVQVPNVQAVRPLVMAGAAASVGEASWGMRASTGKARVLLIQPYLEHVGDVYAKATESLVASSSRALAQRCGASAWQAFATLSAVVGQATQPAGPAFVSRGAIEQLRRELVALVVAGSGDLERVGLVPAGCEASVLELYPAWALLDLRTARDGKLEAQAAAARAWVLHEAFAAGALRSTAPASDGTLELAGQALWRSVISRSLAHVTKAMIDADAAAARALWTRHAKVNTAWAEAARRQAQRVAMPDRFVLLSPRLKETGTNDATLVDTLGIVDAALWDAGKIEAP